MSQHGRPVTLRRVDVAERRIVEPLWQLYVHDFSEFSGATLLRATPFGPADRKAHAYVRD